MWKSTGLLMLMLIVNAIIVAMGAAIAQQVAAATLEPGSSEHFGTFNDVEYIRHTGRPAPALRSWVQLRHGRFR